MVAATSLETRAPPAEQRMLLRDVSWKEYVLLRDGKTTEATCSVL
jgi:hypothetical protein